MVNRSSLPPMSYQPYHVDARLTEGVISRRFWAYLIDLFVVAIWIVLICIAISLASVVLPEPSLPQTKCSVACRSDIVLSTLRW